MRASFLKKLKLNFLPSPENNFRPHFLESRFLTYYFLALLILKLLTLTSLFYLPKSSLFADLSKITLIQLLNQEREKLGLSPLKENSKLSQAAFLKAQDILSKDYFSHQSPEGKSPWYWFKLVNYRFQYAGENLAIGFLDSEEVYYAWKNSPSHRANLFNPYYQETGIAILKGEFQGNETYVIVQLFGTSQKEKSSELTQKETVPQKTAVPKEVPPPPLEKTEKEAERVPPEESKPRENKVAIEETEEIKEIGVLPYYLSAETQAPKNKLKIEIFKFWATTYNKILNNLIFYSLLVVIVALFLNIFVRFDIQHRDLILRSFLFLILLVVFLCLNKEMMIKILPHNLLI